MDRSERAARLDERNRLRLAYAAETRRFEIERFWQRSLFFWTILGSAFIGYAALAGRDETARFVLSCFGVVASLSWTLQNRGAKYWQEAWEQKTKRYQRAVLGTDLFSRIEPRLDRGFFGAARFSVSQIAIILSDYAFVAWLLITGSQVADLAVKAFDMEASGLNSASRRFDAWQFLIPAGVTILFCILLLRAGRSRRDGETA